MRAFHRTRITVILALALLGGYLLSTVPAIARPARLTSTKTATYGEYRLDWSASADMSGAAPLAGSTVNASPAWVRMVVTTAPQVGIRQVEWMLNGNPVGTDADPTYDLSHSFREGDSRLKAIVRFADGRSKETTASFTTSASGTSTTSTSSTTSTTVASAPASYGAYVLDWSAGADMAGAAPLNGATTSANTIWVRLRQTSAPSIGISVVKWYANGALVRDNDVDAPYDLAPKGWAFPDGASSANGVVHFSDGTTKNVTASFTTKAASTTTPPPSGLPFAGPGTVGHLANLPGYNVPASSLTTHQGDLVSSRDGQVIEGLNITGKVLVQHRDVVVRRNRIGLGVISSGTTASARVEWNTIGPEYGKEATSKSDYLAGNGRGQNITFYRNEIFGGIDLFNFYNTTGNVRIEENWVYGAYQMLDDPYQTGVSHSDGIQVHWGGRGYHILRNRFDLFLFRGYYWSGDTQVQYSPRPTAKSNLGKAPNVGPMTTGFLMQQTNGQLDDIVFDGNHVDGDYKLLMSFTRNDFRQSATNVRITNNTFVRRHADFGRNGLIAADTPGNIVFADNKDDSGALIPTPPGMRSTPIGGAIAPRVDQTPGVTGPADTTS